MTKAFGGKRHKVSPFFLHTPGIGIAESYPAPIGRSDSIIRYRINDRLAITYLLEKEEKEPGTLKRGLCWLSPFPDPPCWHQVKRVELAEVRLGVEVTLHLTPCPKEEKL